MRPTRRLSKFQVQVAAICVVAGRKEGAQAPSRSSSNISPYDLVDGEHRLTDLLLARGLADTKTADLPQCTGTPPEAQALFSPAIDTSTASLASSSVSPSRLSVLAPNNSAAIQLHHGASAACEMAGRFVKQVSRPDRSDKM